MRVELYKIRDWCADLQHIFGIVEHLFIATVPGDNIQVGVYNADAGGDILERRKQNFLIKAKCFGGFTKHADYVFYRNFVAASQAINHGICGGNTGNA